MQKDMVVQSNSMRGEPIQAFVKRVVNEILQDIAPAFGPGASDYFMMKENAPYYTRDGKEIMESLTFDNELAREIHHILYQAAYQQGKKAGDGTTTLELFYCLLYIELYRILYENKVCGSPITMNINWIRQEWRKLIDKLKGRLKEIAQPMTEERLLSMLNTCTQDPDLSAKIFCKLREPLMAGAYIIPRKSNIASDFEMTAYTYPIFKATKQFTIRHGRNKYDHATLMYCNGVLDIAHYEVFLSLAQKMLAADNGQGEQTPIDLDIIILCHGVTERTRQSLREFSDFLKSRNIDINGVNNITIFTMDEYRQFSKEELEDVATIITDEPGLGGLVQPITYEVYLHRAFSPNTVIIDDLDNFDADPHIVMKMKENYIKLCSVEYDENEGLMLQKDLGPIAQERYNELRSQIDTEKSEIKKVELNRRLRRSYGMFIDIQVGSALLKDSQRKFELVLDAIISASEGVREGVLDGNSILTIMKILTEDEFQGDQFAEAIFVALSNVMGIMMLNNEGTDYSERDMKDHANNIINLLLDPYHDIKDFNFAYREPVFWPSINTAKDVIAEPCTVSTDDYTITIPNKIVEPVGIMMEILENSILPVELLKTKVFHISGNIGFMNNFID